MGRQPSLASYCIYTLEEVHLSTFQPLSPFIFNLSAPLSTAQPLDLKHSLDRFYCFRASSWSASA